MITVSVTESGDVAYVCSVCDFTQTVPYESSKSVWWHDFNGMTILLMLGHYGESHSPDLLAKMKGQS